MPEPNIVNGHPQTPMAGISMRYCFNDAQAEGRHITQYNECAGNRSIYHDGWLAAVNYTIGRHRHPVGQRHQGRRRAHRQDHGGGLLAGRRDRRRGVDAYSPVTDGYDPWDNAFTGTINKIVVNLTADEGHHTQARGHAFRN